MPSDEHIYIYNLVDDKFSIPEKHEQMSNGRGFFSTILKGRGQEGVPSSKSTVWPTILLMEEIPNNHLGWC